LSERNRLFLGDSGLEVATGREFRHGGRCDRELFAGLRVLAFTSGAGRCLEGAETDQGDGIAIGDGTNDCTSDGIEGFGRISLVPVTGIELVTFALRMRCSTN
jgi:hypothetical protein